MRILTPADVSKRDLRLRDNGIFSGMSEAAIDELEARGTFVEYAREMISREEEPIHFFSFVVHGVVDITKLMPSTGREAILASLVKGQCFGEMSLLLDAPASANVVAREEVVTWVVRHAVLRHYFCQNAEGGRLIGNIAALLAQRLVQTNRRLVA